jgi:hypothetical protein
MTWAALAAATIQRYLAHTTQLIAGVEISTRKVAMRAVHVLLEVLVTLVKNFLIASCSPGDAPLSISLHKLSGRIQSEKENRAG